MRVGRYTKPVTLSRSPQETNDADGFFEALEPEDWWCSLAPQGSAGDGRTMLFTIEGRWHPQITTDTRIVYADQALERERQFFVRSIRNIDERNREMQLEAEEVLP